VVELAARYPTDVGVVCALFMNRVTLQPGEAVFLAAGNLHAYLRGTGVEIMASSDNVLRVGLTVRRVDFDELLKILDTTPGPAPFVTPVALDDVETAYPVPVPDFALSRLALRADQPSELPSGRPQILLVVDGAVEVAQGGSAQTLVRGQAAFFPAADPTAVLTGAATAFLATTTPGEGSGPGTGG
jgi:mannose-6-phosphate isomerase